VIASELTGLQAILAAPDPSPEISMLELLELQLLHQSPMALQAFLFISGFFCFLQKLLHNAKCLLDQLFPPWLLAKYFEKVC